MKKQKLLLWLPFLSMSLGFTSCSSNNRPIKDYILELPYKDNFKILQLTDIHFSNQEDDAWINKHFRFMEKTIDMASEDGHKPDLIAVTGDFSYEGDKRVINMLFNWLDEQEIPWTITFGNHDTRSYFSMDWLLNRIAASKFSVFKNMGNDGVHGDANFAINLVTEDGKVKDQIIVLDSNRYRPNDLRFECYDYLYPSQLRWYRRLVEYTTKQNDGIPVPSYCFFHIPVNEYQEAWKIHDEDPTHEEERGVVYHSGDFREKKYYLLGDNTGFFSLAKELNSTRAIMVGHDHINDFWVTYQGIHLIYGIKSTGNDDVVYCDHDVIGGRYYNLEHVDDDEFAKDCRHDYEEMVSEK